MFGREAVVLTVEENSGAALGGPRALGRAMPPSMAEGLRAGLVKGAFTEEEDSGPVIACMNEGGLTWMQSAERIRQRW